MDPVPNAVSSKLWEPIFEWRTRPLWTQNIVFQLLRQLKALRRAPISLPSIDTLRFPPHRQLRVVFGDMDGLCDALDNAVDNYGVLGVAYGGPDDRGTLWLKLYKSLSVVRGRESNLQFIIWIDSKPPAILTLEETTNLVLKRSTGPTKPLDITSADQQQQQQPCSQFYTTTPDALDLWRERDIAREVIKAWVHYQSVDK